MIASIHELFKAFSGGQFQPVYTGQFQPVKGGQFKSVGGGQFHRFLHVMGKLNKKKHRRSTKATGLTTRSDRNQKLKSGDQRPFTNGA
jgi:hypothetical protein